MYLATPLTADLESAMREVFEIPLSTDCRVWHCYLTHTYELLSRSDQFLQDAGLYNGQVKNHTLKYKTLSIVFLL